MAKTNIEYASKFLSMDDNKKIQLHSWMPKSLIKKTPKFIVCISHGMAEHAKRYDDFAKYLCENDIFVYAHDHRGHGASAKEEGELGVLSQTHGFQRVVLDLREVIQYAKNISPGVKTIVLGHSFGSFIAQSYIQQFSDEVDACILSGTAGPNAPLTVIGEGLANIVRFLAGVDKPSPFLDTVTFGSYNNKIKKPHLEKAWLSRDDNEVKEYQNDPLCGFICSAGFFSNLTHGLNTIHKEKNIRKVRKDIPILLFAGTADPVGSYTKTIRKLANLYRKHDVRTVVEKYYTDGRHEMINEINKKEVYYDVLSWINTL